MNRMKFSGCVRTGVVALAAVFGFGAAAEEADVRASADYLRRTAGKDVRYPVLLDAYSAQPIMTAAQKGRHSAHTVVPGKRRGLYHTPRRSCKKVIDRPETAGNCTHARGAAVLGCVAGGR